MFLFGLILIQGNSLSFCMNILNFHFCFVEQQFDCVFVDTDETSYVIQVIRISRFQSSHRFRHSHEKKQIV